MKFEEVLRNSRRITPSMVAQERWGRTIFAAEPVGLPGWFPNLASGVAVAGMLLLLWPAAARGPVGLRAAGEACDGRWELAAPLRVDVRGLARPQPLGRVVTGRVGGAGSCGLCHVSTP